MVTTDMAAMTRPTQLLSAPPLSAREGLPRVAPGASPSGAVLPQDDKGRSGKSSPCARSAILWAERVSRRCSRQASVVHSRHSVFPVPVGLSRTPFTFWGGGTGPWGKRGEVQQTIRPARDKPARWQKPQETWTTPQDAPGSNPSCG